MGLLIALITFTANGPAFASFDLGLESSFDESQAVVIFEENIHVTSSGSGGGIDSTGFSIPLNVRIASLCISVLKLSFSQMGRASNTRYPCNFWVNVLSNKRLKSKGVKYYIGICARSDMQNILARVSFKN